MTTTRKKSSTPKKSTTKPREKASFNWPDDREQAYQEFVRGLELFVVALNYSSCQIQRGAFFEALQKKKLIRNFDAEFSAADVESKHFDGVGRFDVTISNPDSEPFVSISCTFEAHVHASKLFPREFADRFAQSELRLLLTPYARSFISDLTARMSIPPVTIPLSTRL